MESVFFSDTLKKAGESLVEGLMVIVYGTVSYRNEDQPKIRVNDFVELESSIEALTGKLEIDVDGKKVTESALEILKGMLESNPGTAPVSLVVLSEQVGDVVLQMPKARVKPTQDLITALDGIEGVTNVRLIPKPRRGRRLR
jgi:DNA polymerase III alpha subunit